MIIHLIRHGESTANASNTIIGGVSASLTQYGRYQSSCLGAFLEGSRQIFKDIYTSPYERARDTAAIVNEQMGGHHQIIEDKRLVEISRGDWDGQPLTLITKEVRAEMDADPLGYRTPSGESIFEVAERMYSWLEDVEMRYAPSDQISVFTHGHAIRSLLWKLFSFDPSAIRFISIHNTSITTIESRKGFHLERVNSTPHFINPLARAPKGWSTGG